MTGSIMGGVLSGILLSRMISAGMTELFSWRAVYLVISVCLGIASVSLFLFPESKNTSNGSIRYYKLLRSIVKMIREEGDLRKRMISGMSSFLVFNFLWTGLTFLLSGPTFQFDSFSIGLFGLAGVSGILASKRAGALFDRGLGEGMVLYAWAGLGVSWLVLLGAFMAAYYSISAAVVLLGAGLCVISMVVCVVNFYIQWKMKITGAS